MTARLILTAAIVLTLATPASAQRHPDGILSDGCGRTAAQCSAAPAPAATPAPPPAWAPAWGHRPFGFRVTLRGPGGIR